MIKFIEQNYQPYVGKVISTFSNQLKNLDFL